MQPVAKCVSVGRKPPPREMNWMNRILDAMLNLVFFIAGMVAMVVALTYGGTCVASERPSWEALAESTVYLHALEGPGSGSAFVVGQDSLLTAQHVLDSAAAMEVNIVGTSDRKVTTTYIPEDTSHGEDYGFAHMYTYDMKPLEVDCAWRPTLGARVSVLGYPGLLEGTLLHTEGYISGPTSNVEGREILILADLVAAAGMSGSPVFNEDRKVIGILTALMNSFRPTPMGMPDITHLIATLIMPVSAIPQLCK